MFDQFLDPVWIKSALKRRWWIIALPVLLLAPLAAGVAYILPASYTATARILVESPQIPESLAPTTVNVGVAERIAVIRQRLMTRQNVLETAQKFDVTASRGEMSPTEIVDLMRASTRIAGVQFGGGATGVNISFTTDRADLAAQIANEYLTLVLEQNLQQRSERAFGTSAYFRQEAERLRNELSILESRVTAFKIENEQALPESLPFRRQELSNLQGQRFEREVRREELQDQKERVIEAVRSGEFDGFAREPTPEEVELSRLRSTLLQRSTTYSSSHPVVRALQTQIEALEARVEGEIDEEGASATLQEQVTRILESLDERIETLEEQLDSDANRIAALEASIERTPRIELELSRLTRELSTLQTQYREVVLKLATAETGERLEVNQKSERFEVIERAEVPPAPTSPNRPLIVAAGFVGSLGLGFGLALLAELLNRSLRTPADVERQLGVHVIAAIPYVPTRGEAARRKWTTRILVTLVVVIAPLTLFAIDQYYLPLPLLAERLMDASGANQVLRLIENRFGG